MILFKNEMQIALIALIKFKTCVDLCRYNTYDILHDNIQMRGKFLESHSNLF